MMILNQPLLYADRPTKNKTVYTMRVVEKMCFEAQEAVRNRTFLCRMGMPDDTAVRLEDACGIVTRMAVAGSVLCGDIETLSTPLGRILERLVEGGGRPAFRTFGVGHAMMRDGAFAIHSDFKFLGIACVRAEEAT